jgi:hypothetical protein
LAKGLVALSLNQRKLRNVQRASVNERLSLCRVPLMSIDKKNWKKYKVNFRLGGSEHVHDEVIKSPSKTEVRQFLGRLYKRAKITSIEEV